MEQNFWKKCNTCGKEIGFGKVYQKCSVSSCSKYAYCSVDCWDLHGSVVNHKSAWAEESRAPMTAEKERAPRRIIVSKKPESTYQTDTSELNNTDIPMDILIVASKLKAYIKAKSGMSTSANVMDALSDIVRHECDKAIMNARREGRKTVMDRDF